MSRSTTYSADAEHESTDTPPGSLLGIDGTGRTHYYQTGTRTVTVEDADGQETHHLDHDEDVIGWGIAVVEETGEAWEKINIDSPFNMWLTGEIPVGEFPEDH